MRILVTRARDDAARTADKLMGLGHEALIAPVLRLVRTSDPAPLAPYDAAIVTSAHAVEALASHAHTSLPIYAVGERTADALRRAGFLAVTTGEGDAVSLSRLIRARLEPSCTLLHVTGRHHKEEPDASLRAAGFRVLTWEAYEAEAVDRLPEAAAEALRTGQIGAVLHYSRRSADVFIRLAGKAGLDAAIPRCPHLCLSADVAAPLNVAGAATLVACEPNEDSLLSLLPSLS